MYNLFPVFVVLIGVLWSILDKLESLRYELAMLRDDKPDMSDETRYKLIRWTERRIARRWTTNIGPIIAVAGSFLYLFEVFRIYKW